ncbi:efflux RND transporter permease subunit (plasmid) [Methylocystis sp. MJC1]|jgi:multidrug efflux pump subunit AcrB|uniref:efflux RND transporter permease subunit n=1 Tax=Methylocystis sp. MJC1 TaxID=2654282 RepID=UPI0013EDE045|nr:efflux RND transporter permease subunit [Methylocystis sp. MJC1]KAF2991528.1 Multidrug resistance protein MdtC [Methylocystis sp. MJC1]MBU6529160.1 efflux RND transporter permease subunit [Methylocystis sp. MJC1]UZX13843.1 efflux RND transporter permease subunit [Methylocystis sp. MJC1]
MNLVSFALRRPITVVVLVVATVLMGVFATLRMPRDIFPNLGIPVLYVAQPYGGMDPAQMEGYLVNYYEYHFLYITGIEHVESKSIQGVGLIKLQFQPGTDMAGAMAETVAYVNRARAFMPRGTVPPFVMRFDAGSVPVGDLVFSDESGKLSLKELQDAALFRVRPLFATLPGVSAPPPFGGSPRAIVISVDPERLTGYNMSPDEIVQAIVKGNAISPSGNVRFGSQMPMVPVDTVATDASRFGDIAIRSDGTRTIYVRDIGTVADSSDIEFGYALVNGRHTVFIPVTKRADASTLSVVSLVKENIPKFQAVLPPGAKVSYEFDQSPFVNRAISGLTQEGGVGAVLTGFMVLLFLRDWRSALVVVVNIPLSILAATVALWASGQTINLMTLGGLALAVGILVDEATVAIENIHAHMARGSPLANAAYDGTTETITPRFLAMLSILAVFISAFFMKGAARSLFVPLALAVGFAMVASFILSSTLVPVLTIWLLRGHGSAHDGGPSRFGRFRDRYREFLVRVVRRRGVVLASYLIIAGLVTAVAGGALSRAIFPVVDAGQLAFRMSAPAGTRIEETEKLAGKTIEIIRSEVGSENVGLTLGFVGVQNAAYPINTIYLWTSGPQEAVLQLQLSRESRINVAELVERLRARLSQELPDVRFSFEPSDIVSRVMSFGAPTPIEVAINSPDFSKTREFAQKIEKELRQVQSLRDLQFGQQLDYPAVKVEIDRRVAGTLGVTADQIGRSLTEATSSSRFTVPNFWADPKSGVGYQVQVQVPPRRMDSLEQIKNIPVARNNEMQIDLRAVADVTKGTVLGEYDRYNMQRMLTLQANIIGEDLGGIARQVSAAIAKAGDPPKGVTVTVRGQVTPMEEMFGGLALGFGVSVVAIFLLLAANFESFRLALAVVLMIPAVMAGVAVALWLTRTSLNIESLIGSIMAIGVAVANAILLVSFAERDRVGGAQAHQAAVSGATGRLRPILMTSCAMIAGMLPMAIGIGEGGSQTAPLGRAVIGGLMGATVATLIILPAIFALLQGKSTRKSPSLLRASLDHADARG